MSQRSVILAALLMQRARQGAAQTSLRGSGGVQCFHMYSQMEFNNLVQTYPDNPDSHATAYADCHLCTNGTMTCEATVYSGSTQLIASHIHLATDGDGTNGSGPPVINFCGDNRPGFIDDGTMYPSECSSYKDGQAYMPSMQGALVKKFNDGMTLADRVKDIAANPDHYYFNFHSVASWMYWQNHGGDPVGMCRGKMQRRDDEPVQCFHFYSDMQFNSLVQNYPGNPDSQATGAADCHLCTNGTMNCQATVYSGRTQLIASHIHVANDGDGKDGSGPPVINFCGDNRPGFIDDGTMYLSECSPSEDGRAYMPSMEGAFVKKFNQGMTVSDRVKDIAANPDHYYFNFHSVSSWMYWQNHGGDPVGMCRGQMMKLSM